MKSLFILILTSGLIFSGATGLADEMPSVSLVIKDHRFQPSEITVPSGVKVKLLVHNQDSTPEEFESYELGREKIIAGGKQAVIYIGPLKPGRYPFFGEFHEKTAKGTVIVK